MYLQFSLAIPVLIYAGSVIAQLCMVLFVHVTYVLTNFVELQASFTDTTEVLSQNFDHGHKVFSQRVNICRFANYEN